MINGFNVIDAHCHIYPEKIAERAAAGTDKFYGVKSAFDGTIKTLKEVGPAAGIDHFIVQSVATTPKQVTSINEFIASSVAESDGKFTGLGTLHPDSADMAGDVKRIVNLGLRGVKLHPDIQQFKIDDYRCLRIYELCEAANLPILMHTGDSRYDYSNPNRLIPVMKIYSGLTIVGAHLGCWSLWDESVDELVKLPNLYVDCSSCFGFTTPEKAKKIIEKYGEDRVLFGTDYPMWEPAKELKTFLSFGFDDEFCKKVLFENARRIFMDEEYYIF